jgi:hypothetical protein
MPLAFACSTTPGQPPRTITLATTPTPLSPPSSSPIGGASSDRAYAYLESIQSLAYEELGRVPTAFDARSKKEIEELATSLSNTYAGKISATEVRERVGAAFGRTLPTRFQDPLTHDILANLLQPQIESAAQHLELSASPSPIFGTLPTPLLNAETVPVPGTDQRLIVLYDKLFLFANEFTKAVVETIPIDTASAQIVISTSSAEIKQRLADHPELRQRFAGVLLGFLGLAPLQDHYLTESKYFPLLQARHAMELFVVGHEYGHVIRHHTANDVAALNLTPPLHASSSARTLGGQTPQRLQHSWFQELEADFIGQTLMLEALRIHDTGNAFLERYASVGAIFFFVAQDILDQTQYLVGHGVPRPPLTPQEEETLGVILDRLFAKDGESVGSKDAPGEAFSGWSDHPPPWLRALLVERALQATLPATLTGDDRSAVQLSQLIVRNARLLFEVCQDDLLDRTKSLRDSRKGP